MTSPSDRDGFNRDRDESALKIVVKHAGLIEESNKTPVSASSHSVVSIDEDEETFSARTPRIESMKFGENERVSKGFEYVDLEEAKQNFYRNRIHLNNVSKFIDPTKAFVFKEHFKKEKREYASMYNISCNLYYTY